MTIFLAIGAFCAALLSLLGVLAFIWRDGERRGAERAQNTARDRDIDDNRKAIAEVKAEAKKAIADLKAETQTSTDGIMATITRHHEEEMAEIRRIAEQLAGLIGEHRSIHLRER